MKKILLLIVSVVSAYSLALLWWRLWMYQGFWGPPDFLAPFFRTDGEGVYLRVELEMFFILLPLVMGVVFGIAALLRDRGKAK